MSEYVTIEVEFGDAPDIADLYVNQTLTEDAEERYANPAEGDLGSPIAQTLFAAVAGLRALTISPDCLTLEREPGYEWEAIIDEVRDVLRDWYL